MEQTKTAGGRDAILGELQSIPDLIAQFTADAARETGRAIAQLGRLLITGEGSNRLFPARHLIATARRQNWPVALHTEEPRQAQEYDLSNWAVFGSCSGQDPPDLLALFENLQRRGHKHLYALAAAPDTTLAKLSGRTYILKAGADASETRSVVEQALFYQAMLEHGSGIPLLARRSRALADQIRAMLQSPIPAELHDRLAGCETIYFIGRNDGIGDELALKAFQLTGKTAIYLEGRTARAAAMSVATNRDAFICVDPGGATLEEFRHVTGAAIVAISPHVTDFPTLVVPESDLQPYATLVAGWKLVASL